MSVAPRPAKKARKMSTRTQLAPRQRLGDEAYDVIKKMITSNELESGEVVSVVTLAEHLGVSRSPITSAIRTLEREGLIVSEPFKAPRVATLSAKFVRDVYDVRIPLEVQATLTGVTCLTDDDIEQLRCDLSLLKEGSILDDLEQLTALDVRLHNLFIMRSDNAVLSGFLENLDQHLTRIRNVYSDHIYGKKEGDVQRKELKDIITAAISRDRDMTVESMESHLTAHAQRLITKVGESIGRDEDR